MKKRSQSNHKKLTKKRYKAPPSWWGWKGQSRVIVVILIGVPVGLVLGVISSMFFLWLCEEWWPIGGVILWGLFCLFCLFMVLLSVYKVLGA